MGTAVEYDTLYSFSSMYRVIANFFYEGILIGICKECDSVYLFFIVVRYTYYKNLSF